MNHSGDPRKAAQPGVLLSEIREEGVEEHLNFCRTCCGELEFAEELQRFMRSRQSDEIPKDVRHRLESILSELKEP